MPSVVSPSQPACYWIVTDGAAGNQRQASALADGLGIHAQVLRVELRAPWSSLAPRLSIGLPYALRGPDAELLRGPPPRLVIGCGRQAALLSRDLRERSQGKCQAIQILDPGIDPRHWDLVITPAHDRLRGPNVINPIGSLHPIDEAWLQHGRAAWPALGQLPQPRIGLLLGGPRRGVVIDQAYLRRQLDQLSAELNVGGGSILLMCSRRTPVALQALAQDFAAHHPGLCWRGPVDGANPYQAVLGWADRLVVTPDSINMLSEACASGRPLHCPLPEAPLPARWARFIQHLQHAGQLDTELSTPPQAVPLRELAAIAADVRRRLGWPAMA